MEETKKYAVVVQTIEKQLLAIGIRVDTAKVGLEVKKIDIKKYLKILQGATDELYVLLIDKNVTEVERVTIKNMLIHYNSLIEKTNKKIRWKNVRHIGYGLLTLGAFTLVQL